MGFIEKNKSRLPPDTGSRHAQEGTLAHELSKQLLKTGKLPAGDHDEEMLAHVEQYVKFVKEHQSQFLGTKGFVEQKVPLFYDRSQEGTADVVLLPPKTAVVIDLKYGEGVSVEAVRNPQLAIYLKSWLKAKGVKLHPSDRVVLIIYQPRARDNRFVRKWDTTMAELDEFCTEIQGVAVDILLDPDNQPFHAEPDTVCRWCKAKAICPAYAELLFKETPETVSLVTEQSPVLPEVTSLTPEQVAKVLQYRGDLEGWLQEVYEYAVAMQDTDSPIPNLKRVAGRGSRQWGDEKWVIKHLRKRLPEDSIFERSLRSPAQMLKLPEVKRDTDLQGLLNKWITKVEGAPLLVHESDPRPNLDNTLSSADKELL